MTATYPATFTCTISVRNRRMEFKDRPTITAGEARSCLVAAATDRPDSPCPYNVGLTRADANRILAKALPDGDDVPIHHTIAANVLRLVLHRKRL